MKINPDPIDSKKAKEMVNLYRDYCGKHPQGKLTKSVWYSLKQLKEIISLIDERTDLTEPGIRFYFGTYTETTEFKINEKTVDYIYRNTLLIVPTTQIEKDGIKVNLDFNLHPIVNPDNHGELCPDSCEGTDQWD